MTLPSITDKQKEILFLIYKFRFITTNHIQQLLDHQNPTRIQQWLKDLIEKGYVQRRYERKIFGENTKPAVYYLASKARHILNEREGVDLKELNRVYNEKRREKKFIDHNLFLADIYLFFLTQKQHDQTLHFLTKAELRGLDYFPDPLPDVYIVVETKDSVQRYFLDFFDDYVPPFVLRNRVKYYLKYKEEETWEENTNNSEFPSLLFVCPHEKRRKHITYFAKSIIDKSFEDLPLYLTTKKIIEENKAKDIWQKVA